MARIPGSPLAAASGKVWVSLVWLGILLALAYGPVLGPLAYQWSVDEDMTHGFLVPAVAIWAAWGQRARLAEAAVSTGWAGLSLVALGGIQFYIATLGAELFLSRTAFVLSLAGAVWFLWGPEVTRILAFPLGVLVFMVPIPAVLYNAITFPLQLLASAAAEITLQTLQIPVFREGNVLELAEQKLSVVEACSGIRSLLSLSFLAAVYGFQFESRSWMRALLFGATVPIAIVTNAGRVAATGVLAEFRPDLARGFFHGASGLVIFIAALALLVLFHQAANLVFRRRNA